MKKQGGVFLGRTNDYDGEKDVYRLKRGKQDVWVEVWPESMREGMYSVGVTPADPARP